MVSVRHLRTVSLVGLRDAVVVHQQRVLCLVYCILGVVFSRQRFVIHEFGEAGLHITIRLFVGFIPFLRALQIGGEDRLVIQILGDVCADALERRQLALAPWGSLIIAWLWSLEQTKRCLARLSTP